MLSTKEVLARRGAGPHRYSVVGYFQRQNSLRLPFEVDERPESSTDSGRRHSTSRYNASDGSSEMSGYLTESTRFIFSEDTELYTADGESLRKDE